MWSPSSESPLQRYTEHSAAIKAIAWSPHQHGILASGGGTADKTIRFWNTLTGQSLQSVDTGSQVHKQYKLMGSKTTLFKNTYLIRTLFCVLVSYCALEVRTPLIRTFLFSCPKSVGHNVYSNVLMLFCL